MLRRIRLTNFRKHNDRQVTFGGITAIVGPNGAGKSTVLDAIELALYPDQFHSVAHNVQKGKNKAEVFLELSANGRTVTFHVTLRTGGKRLNPSVYYGNGQMGEHDSVRRQVGLPGSLEKFEILHYLKQGVLNTSPKGIASTVRRMLGIDRIRKFLEILKDLEREFGGKIDTIRQALPLIDDHFRDREGVELGDLERRIERLNREIARGECEARLLRGRIGRLEREIKRLKGEIERAERRRREIEERLKRRGELQGRIDGLQKDVERLSREIGGMSVEVEEDENLESVGKDRRRVRRDIEAVIRLNEKLKGLMEKAEEKRKGLDALRSALKGYLDLLEPWEPDEVRVIWEYSKAKVEAERTAKAYREYEELTKAKNDVENKLSRLREVWRRLKEMEGLKGKIEGVLGRLPSLEEYERRLDTLREEVASLKAEEEHESKRLEALRGGEDRCPVCGREIPDPQAVLMDAEERLRGVQDALKKKEGELKRYASVREKVRRYHDLAHRVMEDVKELDGVSLPTDAPLEELRRSVEEIGKRLKEEKEEKERRFEKLKEAHERHIAAKRRVEEYGRRLPVAPESVDVEGFASLPEEVVGRYEDMRRLEREMEGLGREVNEITEQLENVRRRYPEAGEDLEGYLKGLEESLSIKEEYLRRLYEKEKKEREIEKLKRELEELGDPERELEEVRKEIERMREKTERKQESLKGMEMDLQKREEDLKDKRDRVAKLRDKHDEWKKLLSLRERVRLMRERVGEKQQKFIESRRRVFENRVAHYFLSVFGHGTSYSKLEMDESLMPILTLHNGERVLVSYGRRIGNDQIALSGGEKTAMYLSYIMALREIVGRERGVAPILLLDEPTTHLDTDRREDVWEMLDTLHREKGIQIVVVTHDIVSFNGTLGSKPGVRIVRL